MWVIVLLLLAAVIGVCRWVRVKDPAMSKSESQYLRDMEELGPRTEAGLYVDQERRKIRGIESVDK